MNILVTGGAGYIGSHTCKALAKAGFNPITYDNLSTGHNANVQWGPLIIGDLQDRKLLKKTIQEYKPNGVLHFAASALVIESMQNPPKYYDNNVAGSIALLEVMREENISSLVFSSTCATYGHPEFSPITEEHPQKPINPYGRSKLIVEQIINDYPIHAVILRYFNAAGADPESKIGEDHTPETHLIPSIIETAMGKRKALTVYGTDFPTKDGSAVRDYIHVEDLADAHVKALKWVLANQKSTAINLGTGIGLSIFEILKKIEAVSEKQVATQFENKREGEPAHLVADNKKAHELLGWTPKHSSLSSIIETAWKWHSKC